MLRHFAGHENVKKKNLVAFFIYSKYCFSLVYTFENNKKQKQISDIREILCPSSLADFDDM
jgi:hypothetical protein